MTLILSVVSPSIFLQVSDRKVTWQMSDGSMRERDDATNKALVYCGRIALAFTGVAEVEGEPTDVWAGNVLAQAPGLGEGLAELRDRATEAFLSPTLRGLPLAFAGGGWKYEDDGQLVPFFTIISNFVGSDGWTPTPGNRFFWQYGLPPRTDRSG